MNTAQQIKTSSGAAGLQGARREQLQRLCHAIDHAAHLLPAQGPISVFVHHNTLHAFEDLPFREAVRRAARVYGCEPYLSEARYREALTAGRIRHQDVDAVLREELGDASEVPVAFGRTRLELRRAMMEHPLCTAPASELRWLVAESNALRRFRPEASREACEHLLQETRHWVLRDLQEGAGVESLEHESPHKRSVRSRFADLFQHFGAARIEDWSHGDWEEFTLKALWRTCRDGVHGVKVMTPAAPLAVRHRDLLVEAGAADSDALVHEVLIRFCAAFLDQGFAQAPLPRRSRGFFEAFCALYGQRGGLLDAWMKSVPAELRGLAGQSVDPLESIADSLSELGVSEGEWDAFLTATLLALRGWAGMIRQIALRGDRVAFPIPDESLLEFLAVRLLLDRHALAAVASDDLAYEGPLSELRAVVRRQLPRHQSPSLEQRAFVVYQLAQILGWSPAELDGLSKAEWTNLLEEIESFSQLERRCVFHLAYERRYRIETLDAVGITAANAAAAETAAPLFQAVFCIDDREESFRRHLEELEPRCETFATAGFFSLPIYYKGAADAHFTALCPIVIRPNHWVTERVEETLEDEHRRRRQTRKLLGRLLHGVHLGSRSFTGGTLVSAGFGVFASIPLIGRILFPRLAARVRRSAARLVAPPSKTQLVLERTEQEPGPNEGHQGFSTTEMADAAERLLRDLGMTRRFARLVLIVGHGSTSLNNPHMSAYGCGACSGANGGPNARGIAQILNDARIRRLLSGRGIDIPSETVFVGGLHNTCKDSVTFFDLEHIPPSHEQELRQVQGVIDSACARNAHERCRRFESAPLSLNFGDALRHVEARSEDLAQTRPELGHVTNAISIVGRRSRTRGLFMDRRAFLTCYDPTQDDADGTILARILQAVFPVCAGINLEYYFSHVDSRGFGCGTKLPHNVSALLGVMDGAASDLRTGLPWQMVEIHEPVRLLFIIETTPELLLKIIERHPDVGTLCRNGWIQLAVLSPTSPDLYEYCDGRFERYQPESTTLPHVEQSHDWYRGWRDHLGFAQIKR